MDGGIFQNISVENRWYPVPREGFKAYDFEKIDVDWYYNISYYMINYVIPLGFSLYLTALYYLHKFMKNRQPYKLKIPFILWNTCFALCYLLIAARVMPELLLIWKDPNAFHQALCGK